MGPFLPNFPVILAEYFSNFVYDIKTIRSNLPNFPLLSSSTNCHPSRIFLQFRVRYKNYSLESSKFPSPFSPTNCHPSRIFLQFRVRYKNYSLESSKFPSPFSSTNCHPSRIFLQFRVRYKICLNLCNNIRIEVRNKGGFNRS